jgi:hypothetical protein
MPFLFFGSRTVRKRLSEGDFDCPRCGARRPYALLRAQHHAHLYWVPLLKLGPPRAYVECQGCRAAFAPSVLDGAALDQDDLRGAVATATTAALAAVLRGQVASAREVDLAAQAMSAIQGRPQAQEVVAETLAAEPRDVGRAARGLAHVDRTLTPEAREGLMTAVLHVATADGPMTQAQSTAVQTLAGALRVSPAHLKGIMVELAERRGAMTGGRDGTR